jgi:hypothetical protein
VTSTLRRIEPLPFPVAIEPALGAKPEFQWVKPTDLWVDETYQRDLKRNSYALIANMRREFRWNRMKPPICVRAAEGLHVIDGQHTAIVAATLRIPAIPVFIVEADELDERARSFVAHNTNRVVVHPLDIFRALVASGDEDALTVQQVLDRSKVRLRMISSTTSIAEGDTMAIGTIRKLVSKHGPLLSRQVLETLVKAKRAPVSAPEISAVASLLCCDPVDRVDAERLAIVIRMSGDEGLTGAQAEAKTSRKPLWRVLANRWSKTLEQSRAA